MIKCKFCGHEMRYHAVGLMETGCLKGDCQAKCDGYEPELDITQIKVSPEALQLYERMILTCEEMSKKEIENATEPLDELQAAFVAFDKLRGFAKLFFAEYELIQQKLLINHGVDATWQDADGTVYKIDFPSGTFVEYKTQNVSRTRRIKIGETKGNLSLTEARKAGYEVEGKRDG